MARTIMVSNDVYEELKRRKGTTKSFSETIKESLEEKPAKLKTMGELLKYAGTLPSDDTEYEEILEHSRKMWNEWQKKLEKELKEESA